MTVIPSPKVPNRDGRIRFFILPHAGGTSVTAVERKDHDVFH
jgi:hypothetical protein